MKLNSKIIEARWDDAGGIWNLTIENPKTKEQWKDWAHVFVNGTGISRKLSWTRPQLTLIRNPEHLEVA